MKLLIVGNRNHQFIYNCVKHFKEYDPQMEIDILSYETKKLVYPNDYLFDNIYCPIIPVILTKNRYTNCIARHFALKKLLKSLGQYDYVHVHYVEKPLQALIDEFLDNIRGKIIISVWGSDFLKRNDSDRNAIKKLFLHSYKIAFTSDKFKSEFCNYYNDNCIAKKTCSFKLGLEPLVFLDKVSRDDFNLNITVGYNARHNQCHIEILESLRNLEVSNTNIQLLLPLTYPKDDLVYITKIKDCLNSLNFNFKTYETFMSDENVARLRINTDIFIQLQKTDVLSGAMLEHIAAGSIVITGDWLPYDDLYNMGIELIRVSKRSDVGNKLQEVIRNIDHHKLIARKNAEIVRNNFTWDHLVPTIIRIYD